MIPINSEFTIEELICDELFQQYCLGSDLKNQILWDEFIQNHPERHKDFEEAKHLVVLLSGKQGSRSLQLKELQSGLKQREAFGDLLGADETPVVRLKNRRLVLYSGIAAAMVAGLLISVYFFKPNSPTNINSPLAINSTTYSGKALRKTVVLEDGTVITLAAHSNIRLIDHFSSLKRELWLNGEAFFDVKHDKLHPFIVHTTLNDVKVLGTTFNIKAYPDDDTVETSLISGSVRVNFQDNPGYSVLLKPYQKLVTRRSDSSKSNHAEELNVVAAIRNNSPVNVVPKEIQWVANRLEIDNESLESITKKLEAWYGIKIIIADDQIKDYRYSGVFESETILKTLEALQLSNHFSFRAEHDKITLTR